MIQSGQAIETGVRIFAYHSNHVVVAGQQIGICFVKEVFGCNLIVLVRIHISIFAGALNAYQNIGGPCHNGIGNCDSKSFQIGYFLQTVAGSFINSVFKYDIDIVSNDIVAVSVYHGMGSGINFIPRPLLCCIACLSGNRKSAQQDACRQTRCQYSAQVLS